MRRAGEPRAYIEARVRVEDRGFSSPCWVWQKGLTEKGNARTKIPGFPRQMRVHRAAYELYVGPIPEGLTLDHLCCIKSCCNPQHLEPVTALENWRRAEATGNAGGGVGRCIRKPKTHCGCGVELTPDVTAKGKRRCKPCWAAYMSEWNRTHPDRPRPNRNEYHRLWKQRRKASIADAKKKPAPGSLGERAASDAGLDTHNSGTLSSTFPLDGGL